MPISAVLLAGLLFAAGPAQTPSKTPEPDALRTLNRSVRALTQRVSPMVEGLRQQYGLIVGAKSPQGQGRYIELRPGGVIHAVNTLPVSTVDALRESIDAMKRGAAFRYLAFDIE